MGAFVYSMGLHLKLNLRNKEILIMYYIVPLVFFLFMGGIFTSILPGADKTLIQSMTVFGVSMGGLLGGPVPLAEILGSDIKKAYRAGGVPLWSAAAGNFISGFLHLFLMSAVIFFAAPILFKASVPENLPSYVLSLALLIISSMCVATAFGLFVKNVSKLTLLCQVVFLPSIILSGIMFPADMLPEALGAVGKIFPAAWGFQAMCQGNTDLKLLLPLLIISAALLVICAFRLKRINAD